MKRIMTVLFGLLLAEGALVAKCFFRVSALGQKYCVICGNLVRMHRLNTGDDSFLQNAGKHSARHELYML